MKILFLGMNGDFSAAPMQALLAADAAPEALVLPAPPGMGRRFRRIHYPPPNPEIPGSGRNLLQLAAGEDIPIYETGTMRDPEALDLLADLAPDLILTACFSHILPAVWLETPRSGALNLHPSLLPAYRGPQPLFWQFRNGEKETGVTLHFMDSGMDTGDIVAQAQVPFPDGISEAEAERLAGEAGARLLIEALAQPEAFPRRPQPEGGASYQPAPGPEDLVVPADWEARRAFNFMRGAQGWGPFEVEQVGSRIRVSEALAWQEGGAGGDQEKAAAWLKFPDGYVKVKLVSKWKDE